MQYINGTFNDLRLFLELESVAAEMHLGTNHIFLFFILFIRAVWFTGVALLCKHKAKHKYNTNLR